MTVGLLIETTNSNMLYFIYGLLNMCLINDREYLYQNKNSLLDILSKSIYFFQVYANTKETREYLDEIICREIPLNIKLNIVLASLSSGILYKENSNKFVSANMDSMLEKINQTLIIQQTEYDLETLLSHLYTFNIDSKIFSKKGKLILQYLQLET